MISRRQLENDYFEWLYDLACGVRATPNISYRNLLELMHDTEFYYILPGDADRANDGVTLRYRYSLMRDYDFDASEIMDGPCSVLEMILSLAIRCEETITDDALIGDRTCQWFWEMLHNMGLSGMTDSRFDYVYVSEIIDRFLNREYEPDGRGGLFVISPCDYDLREVSYFNQLCWHLNDTLYS